MPSYNATTTWSAPIAIAVGDLIQLKDGGEVHIRAASQSADPSYLTLNGRAVYPCGNATNIQIKSRFRNTTVFVIKGI